MLWYLYAALCVCGYLCDTRLVWLLGYFGLSVFFIVYICLFDRYARNCVMICGSDAAGFMRVSRMWSASNFGTEHNG